MIILASASPRRRELLSGMGFDFKILTSDADELTEEKEPGRIVEELSRKKAEAVFGRIKTGEEGIINMKGPHLIIAADTLVFYRDEILGKPADTEDAFRMIKELQGNTHSVRTGVTLIMFDPSPNPAATWSSGTVQGTSTAGICEKRLSFHEKTDVIFDHMSDSEINSYIATGEPMDKAGAYGIQGRCAKYIKGINGDYFNVVGFPVSGVYRAMKEIGFLKED